MLLPLESIKDLFFHRKLLGMANFLNFFRVFYMLAEIPKDAQNNPLAMYMSQRSCIRGFKYVFGIDIEEVAIRFYNLFVDQTAVPKVYEIDVVQFFNTAIIMADDEKVAFKELGFKYYDYDSNGQIGSVDIVNFIKYLPYDKIKKIE